MAWQRPEAVEGRRDAHDRGEDGLLVRYLVRAVRIGVVATFAVLLPIGVYPLLSPQVAVTRPGLYAGAVGLGLVGAAAIAVLPWRLLTSRFPFTVLCLWSVGDILLISLLGRRQRRREFPAVVGVRADDPPLRRHLPPTAPDAAVRVHGRVVSRHDDGRGRAAHRSSGGPAAAPGGAGRAGADGGFISSELTRQMATHARRARSSRQVAEAGAAIGALEHAAVLDTLVDAVADLGFAMGAVVMLEGNVYKIAAAFGLPEDFERVRLVLSELHPTTHAWVMRTREIDDEGVVRALDEVGCDAVIVAPLMVGPGGSACSPRRATTIPSASRRSRPWRHWPPTPCRTPSCTGSRPTSSPTSRTSCARR